MKPIKIWNIEMNGVNKLAAALSLKILLIFSITLPAYSEMLVCSGTVTKLAYHANNKLMLQLSSMDNPVFFCSPDAEWAVNRIKGDRFI